MSYQIKNKRIMKQIDITTPVRRNDYTANVQLWLVQPMGMDKNLIEFKVTVDSHECIVSVNTNDLDFFDNLPEVNTIFDRAQNDQNELQIIDRFFGEDEEITVMEWLEGLEEASEDIDA